MLILWTKSGLRGSDSFHTQEEIVASTAFRYISDAITKEEAIQMLKAKAATKKEREAKVRELGYVFGISFDRGSC